MINYLALQTGVDIPFPKARLTIHQPTLKEISLIGEKSFFTGCGFLLFDKNKYLQSEDKNVSTNQSDFEILMSMINIKEIQVQQLFNDALMVLGLIFPQYLINFTPNSIIFTDPSDENNDNRMIDKDNYAEFKQILDLMFCLSKNNQQEPTYNPVGARAKAIADKIMAGRRKVAEDKHSNEDISILEQYLSILAVGEQKDKNTLANYTVPQLFDEINRFQLKIAFDKTFEARLAGAKDMKDPDDWMGNLHKQ